MSTRAEAERLINAIAVGAWQFCSREYHIDQVDQALQAERERAAQIAEGHSATDCDGPDCGVVIAAAIRGKDTA